MRHDRDRAGTDCALIKRPRNLLSTKAVSFSWTLAASSHRQNLFQSVPSPEEWIQVKLPFLPTGNLQLEDLFPGVSGAQHSGGVAGPLGAAVSLPTRQSVSFVRVSKRFETPL